MEFYAFSIINKMQNSSKIENNFSWDTLHPAYLVATVLTRDDMMSRGELTSHNRSHHHIITSQSRDIISGLYL